MLNKIDNFPLLASPKYVSALKIAYLPSGQRAQFICEKIRHTRVLYDISSSGVHRLF